MKEFLFGSAYYPEWWPEDQWETDFTKMQELGLNCVRMGEFAWSWFEPQEGEYDFAPMLRAMDCAHRHGIRVVMGTTTAVCPAWLYKKHPTVKGGNREGLYDFGGRKGQCLSDPHFLEAARCITEAQARALGDHPALVGWQLDNEPGFPFHDFDPVCSAAFREFLREKYGQIDALNHAWFTMEWSNRYNSFEEVDLPVHGCEAAWTQQIQLDYRKFFSRNFHRLLSMEAAIVRKHSPGRFLYTNWPGANWSVNCFEGCEYLDCSAWDNYVGQPNGGRYRIQLRAAMEHAFNRRLDRNRRQFLVAEQKCYVDANTDPRVIAAQTWLNVAYGAFGTLYFEWAAPLGGAEQGYGSLLYPDGSFRPETRPVFEALSAGIRKIYPHIAESETRSRIAAVYSYENSWGTPGWVVDGFYDEEFFNLYGGFQNRLRANVDVASLDDDLSCYKLLLLANCRILSPAQARKLTAFVEEGGTLVLNFACATRDEFNRTLPLRQPGLLADLAGAVAAESISAQEFQAQTGTACTLRFPAGDRPLTSQIHCLAPRDAQVAARYSGGRLEGASAVTVRRVGKGHCILFGTDGNSEEFYEALADLTAAYCPMEPLAQADDGVLLASREADGSTFLFAVNMKDREQTVTLPAPARELLSGSDVSGQLPLAPYETKVFRF